MILLPWRPNIDPNQSYQDRPQKPADLFSAPYGRGTEGFKTADLKEAKALLEELSCPLRLQLATWIACRTIAKPGRPTN
jgi:hypothetical protein